MKDLKLNNQNLSEVLQNIEKDFYDIPFGNTQYQIEKFVINQAQTPQRAYRTIGLQLINLIQSLEDSVLNNEKIKIDIEELEDKLKPERQVDRFERRRLEVDLISKKRMLVRQEKSISDNLKQIEIYHSYYNTLPKYTREEFEQAEENYYLKHLHTQALGYTGAQEALLSMGYGVNEQGSLVKFPANSLIEDIKKLEKP